MTDSVASGIFTFDNSYARLPERFYTRTHPTPVLNPRLIRVNRELAEDLGVDADVLAGPEGVEILAGNTIAEGSEPIATAYAGHQFGGFVPQLGDGRAILLGEVIDRAGNRRDIQLKGSGRTPFSRGGDGRAALGPVLREYIVSEAMYAMGVPTTRSLAAVTTGEEVERETTFPGAVLTRVAASHIRVGTFQFFASRGDVDAVRILADHVIARHYPDLARADNPYRALLDAVTSAQAKLIAQWLNIGFIHGVMNTDNMSIAGETIDYGPCAFMDEYNPVTVFSSIDRHGRYAYNNQPTIAQWNLARLAECLLPLLAENPDAAVESANEALTAFAPQFETAYHAGLRRKLGLETEQESDLELARELLQLMTDHGADFTNTFRRLSDGKLDAPFDKWREKWRSRLEQEPMTDEERRRRMQQVNPAFIPRNHRVEEAIVAATNDADYGPFEKLLTVLRKPFDDQPEFAEYMQPPAEHERVLQTFCGT